VKALGSVAAVIAAVREDADAEVEGIQRDTQRAIDALTHFDTAVAGRPEDAAPVVAARTRARIAAAHDDGEDARVAIGEREEWLARALDLGRAQLAVPQAPAVRRDDLARLTREAIDRLPPGRLDILVSAADAPLLDAEWIATVGGDRHADLTVGVGAVEGGCIVRTADGRVVFDNTWPARHERLQSAWRSAMTDVYEHAVATLSRAGDINGG